MKVAHAINAGVIALALAMLIHCSSKDSYEIWSESVLGAIGGAILNSQGVAKVGRGLPASSVICPAVNDSDPTLADCRAMVNDGITAAAGPYLRRTMLLCQYATTDPGWWRTYHLILFPSQAICAQVHGSADGLTSANVTAFGLVGATITLNYGSGANGDQQNMRFAQNGDVLFLNSIFNSGWKEARKGGTSVKFQAATQRRIFIGGVHAEGYQPLYENVRNPTDLYNDLLNKTRTDVVKSRWDRTVNSEAAGDRLYQVSDAASDPVATANSNIVVDTVGAAAVARTGGTIKTQDNVRNSLGRAVITTDLTYADLKCCWPTTGELTTTFVPFLNAPSSNGKAFQEEVVQFTAGAACGQATLIQRGGELGAVGKSHSVQLYHCQ